MPIKATEPGARDTYDNGLCELVKDMPQPCACLLIWKQKWLILWYTLLQISKLRYIYIYI